MPIDLQSLIILIVIGALVGWIASTRGYAFGLLGNVIVGFIGAYLGQWLFPLLGFGGADLAGLVITATLGAIILLFLVGLLRVIT